MSCDMHRWTLLVFLSSVHELEFTLRNENKRLRSAISFPIRPATLGCRSLWTTRHNRCVLNGLPWREEQLVNSISDVETGPELFHSASTALNRKHQVTECLFENLLLHFKRKINIDSDMVRYKSSKLNNNTELLEGQLKFVQISRRECVRTSLVDRDREWARHYTVLHDHGNNTVN